MGQEIAGGHFDGSDFRAFARRLEEETRLLESYVSEGRLSTVHGSAGFELEAWLVDQFGRPNPINAQFLAAGDNPLVTPELSRFNVELNSTPVRLGGGALGAMYSELEANWKRCADVAAALGGALVMIGILPTVREEMLTLENMSGLERYRALNEQVLRMRPGRPLSLDIEGIDQHLRTSHSDVMLEAATTSFQLHLQLAAERAESYFNAAVALSAPMVAIAANSPLLFGKRLWMETRIPLFEQAVQVGGFHGAQFGPVRRVTFGDAYAERSLLGFYRDNLAHYPALLPADLGQPPERFAHLRLHNGTIWRWNRPLIGFDADGTPHLRLEHRVMAAGPTVVDTIANAALFFGAVHSLATDVPQMKQRLPFFRARDNFYRAARLGLRAEVQWFDGRRGPLTDLIRREILPLARQGLEALECDRDDIDAYLGIIRERLDNGQTGAAWQLSFVERAGLDLEGLVQYYRDLQDSGQPVHRWPRIN